MPEVSPKCTSSENCMNDQLATFPFLRNPTIISKAAAKTSSLWLDVSSAQTTLKRIWSHSSFVKKIIIPFKTSCRHSQKTHFES